MPVRQQKSFRQRSVGPALDRQQEGEAGPLVDVMMPALLASQHGRRSDDRNDDMPLLAFLNDLFEIQDVVPRFIRPNDDYNAPFPFAGVLLDDLIDGRHHVFHAAGR